MMPKGYTVKLKKQVATLERALSAARTSNEQHVNSRGEQAVLIKKLDEENKALRTAKDAYALGNGSMERTIGALQTEAQRLRRINQALSILVVEGASDALRVALATRLRDDSENSVSPSTDGGRAKG